MEPPTCLNCEREQRKVTALIIDLENAQADVIAKNRIIKRQADELAGQRQAHPDADTVMALLRYWAASCGKTKRTRLTLDGTRAKSIRWALKHYDEARIHTAIVGAARYPYRGPYGRRATELTEGYKLDDDVAKICRDEVNFERFERLGLEQVDIAVEVSRLQMLDTIRRGGVGVIELCLALEVSFSSFLKVHRDHSYAVDS